MKRRPTLRTPIRRSVRPGTPAAAVPALVALSLVSVVASRVPLSAQETFMPVRVDEATVKVFLELPPLGRDLLYMNALATSLGSARVFGLDAGAGVDEAVVRFERHGPRVAVVRRNVTMTASSGDPGQVAGVERAFPVSVLATLPVVEERAGRVVVDATDVRLGDVGDVRGTVRAAGLGDVRLERERGYVDAASTGAFEWNTEVRTALTCSADRLHPELSLHAPDGRSVTFEQHHSFVALPDRPMEPRAFDPRTGNSATVVHDSSEGFDGDYRRRYTSRWRIEPSDTAA